MTFGIDPNLLHHADDGFTHFNVSRDRVSGGDHCQFKTLAIARFFQELLRFGHVIGVPRFHLGIVAGRHPLVDQLEPGVGAVLQESLDDERRVNGVAYRLADLDVRHGATMLGQVANVIDTDAGGGENFIARLGVNLLDELGRHSHGEVNLTGRKRLHAGRGLPDNANDEFCRSVGIFAISPPPGIRFHHESLALFPFLKNVGARAIAPGCDLGVRQPLNSLAVNDVAPGAHQGRQIVHRPFRVDVEVSVVDDLHPFDVLVVGLHRALQAFVLPDAMEGELDIRGGDRCPIGEYRALAQGEFKLRGVNALELLGQPAV